jgi:hypothetical protein
MKFVAVESSIDKLVTKGKFYYGGFVWIGEGKSKGANLRVVVYNDKQEWDTYRADTFKPAKD